MYINPIYWFYYSSFHFYFIIYFIFRFPLSFVPDLLQLMNNIAIILDARVFQSRVGYGHSFKSINSFNKKIRFAHLTPSLFSIYILFIVSLLFWEFFSWNYSNLSGKSTKVIVFSLSFSPSLSPSLLSFNNEVFKQNWFSNASQFIYKMGLYVFRFVEIK